MGRIVAQGLDIMSILLLPDLDLMEHQPTPCRGDPKTQVRNNYYVHALLLYSMNSGTFKTPSPGAYRPELAHPPGEKHAPIYSMGSRSRYRKSMTLPAVTPYPPPPTCTQLQHSCHRYSASSQNWAAIYNVYNYWNPSIFIDHPWGTVTTFWPL